MYINKPNWEKVKLQSITQFETEIQVTNLKLKELIPPLKYNYISLISLKIDISNVNISLRWVSVI